MNFSDAMRQAINSRYLPRAVSLLLLLLMGWWVVAGILPEFFNINEMTVDVSTPVIEKSITRPTKPLKGLNLFGEENGVAKAKASKAQVTKLNLVLRGVLATVGDPSQGYAQIESATNEERYFVVKDLIFGQATLEEIYIDRVIILHNGNYETLKLPEEFLNVKHYSIEKQKLERKKIATNYRNLFLSRDAERLRKLFGFDTAWKNGGFVGFIVKALSDEGREMMATLGVEDGDLITVVNGLRFSESLEASQQLTELKTATSVDVIIERNGEELSFHFDFDDPIADKVTVGSSDNRSNVSQSQNPGPGPYSDRNLEPLGSTVNNTFPNNSNTDTNTNINTSNDSDDGDVSSPSFGRTYSSGSSGFSEEDEEEELGVDWDETEEAQEFQAKQRERTTNTSTPVEYDH